MPLNRLFKTVKTPYFSQILPVDTNLIDMTIPAIIITPSPKMG